MIKKYLRPNSEQLVIDGTYKLIGHYRMDNRIYLVFEGSKLGGRDSTWIRDNGDIILDAKRYNLNDWIK
ncbi:hypothetical protein [Paenibacillus dendritiformis]|uniref:hypothetical protein n=1 Tax=Paenibacillus dendritiformis TaxID=130049 RepID=UPI00387E1C35